MSNTAPQAATEIKMTEGKFWSTRNSFDACTNYIKREELRNVDTRSLEVAKILEGFKKQKERLGELLKIIVIVESQTADEEMKSSLQVWEFVRRS